MNTHRSKSTIAIVSFVILLLAGPALFAAEPFARTVTSASEIAWQAAEAFTSADLTVSAPDGRVRAFHFRSGEALRLRASDLPGAIDGTWVFELRLNPAPRHEPRGGDVPRRTDGTNALRSTSERVAADGPARVMSGAFNVRGGLLVDMSDKEGSAPSVEQTGKSEPAPTAGSALIANPEAQVIVDNLVVQASACFGNDCQPTEVFSFDTVRLKENNTRIKFDDTSNSGSFPFTDWQLTANESTNGGLNKFSIEDVTNGRIPFTVLAASPNNSLFVNGAGHIGLRTATPAVDLHMKVGNTPTMRLDQDGTLGFQPQAWDIGGNEVSFFIRNQTTSTMMLEISPGGNWTTSSGATLTGGAWTNASSAALKQDITDLDPASATAVLRDLRPVTFAYKSDPTEQSVGFISEEVPDLVATNDRKGLSSMDVVAVLTSVVQQQQQTIDELSRRIKELEKGQSGNR